MATYKIFLASSAELDLDKEQVELYIGRKNKNYRKKRIFLELSTWKDFISSMTEEHSQEKYNRYIRHCDIAIFLFHTKLGRFTKEEFDVAHETFIKRKERKPLVYTFFRHADDDSPEIDGFKSYIDNLGHFYDTYTSNEDLFVKIGNQLEKLENSVIIKPEPIDLPRIINHLVYYFLLPLIVLAGAIGTSYYYQPTDMTIRVVENKPIPTLPFENGEVTLIYGDKTESLKIIDEAVFKQIPSKYKRQPLTLKFKAFGYGNIDTLLKSKKYIELPVKRDNSLGLIFGSIKNTKNQPVQSAKVSVKGITTQTDEYGRFKLEIPFEKQRETQQIRIYKKGYPIKEITGAPSLNNEWKIILLHDKSQK